MMMYQYFQNFKSYNELFEKPLFFQNYIGLKKNIEKTKDTIIKQRLLGLLY